MSRKASFTLIKDILAGVWSIEAGSANAYLPMVTNIITGKDVQGFEDDAEDRLPVATLQLSSSATPQAVISMIAFHDVITKSDNWCSEGTSSKANRIVEAANDKKVKGIILSFDSPGGSVNAVDIPTEAISYAKTKKPVIAHIQSGMAASAAYWIASQCDEVYTTYSNDQVGSIGVYFTLQDFKEYYAKLGITLRDVYATNSTEKNIEVREALDGKDEKLLAMLNRYNTQFEAIVRAGRPNVDASVFKGALFFADEAMKLGLIDGMKSLDEVVNRIDELAESDKYPTNMFFGKKTQAAKADTAHEFTALIALGNTAAADRTEDQFTAAQAELNAAGIGALITNDASKNDELKAVIGNLDSLQATQAAAQTAIEAANAYTGKKETSVEAAMTSVLAKAQAASKIEVGEGAEKEEQNDEDPLQALSELEHNKKADNL